MRKLLLATATAFIAATGSARADALPKEVLGSWCFSGEQSSSLFKRGKCSSEDSDGIMRVRPNSVEYWESSCTFTSIASRIQTLYSYNNSGRLLPTMSKVYEVKARCVGEGEHWNSTLFFDPLADGSLHHEAFVDNELPTEFQDKTVCKFDSKKYIESESGCEDKNIGLRFEKDRYTITAAYGEGIGFCRLTSVQTVWDSTIPVATKLRGGPVTYISAQCPRGQKLLAMYVFKGTIYVDDKGK
jgi:hypothetical protein